MSLWAVLVTGLLAGGASCAAVQGGLLAGAVARRHSDAAATAVRRSGRFGWALGPTQVVLRSKDNSGCTSAIVFPDLGVEKVLPENGDTVIDVGRLSPGKHRFTCAMGMYSGVIEAVA